MMWLKHLALRLRKRWPLYYAGEEGDFYRWDGANWYRFTGFRFTDGAEKWSQEEHGPMFRCHRISRRVWLKLRPVACKLALAKAERAKGDADFVRVGMGILDLVQYQQEGA